MRLAALAFALSIAACQQQPVTRNEAIQLANDYLRNEGYGNLNGLTPYAVERPDDWIIGYRLSPDYAGGTTTFAVSKQSREIRILSRTQ